MNKLSQKGTAAIAVFAAIVIVNQAKPQTPARIPNGGDQEQIVNLQLRVSHLEQALAQVQQQLAKKNSTVAAPFTVVNSEGLTLFTVDDKAGGEVKVFSIGDDEHPYFEVSPNSLKIHDPTGALAFVATGLEGGGGLATTYSKNGGRATMGDNGSDFASVRLMQGSQGPSGGITLQPDGTAKVYAGQPGVPLAAMIATGGQGHVETFDKAGKPMAWIASFESGGTIGANNSAGLPAAVVEANPKGNGGHGVFFDAGGKTAALTLGAIGSNQGDACIVRGDKPGLCLSRTALPLGFQISK